LFDTVWIFNIASINDRNWKQSRATSISVPHKSTNYIHSASSTSWQTVLLRKLQVWPRKMKEINKLLDAILHFWRFLGSKGKERLIRKWCLLVSASACDLRHPTKVWRSMRNLTKNLIDFSAITIFRIYSVNTKTLHDFK